MKHCVGLDVALKETAICLVDDQRRAPEALAAFLRDRTAFERVAIGAGRWRPRCVTACPRLVYRGSASTSAT
jgi:hypothetical protein